MKKIKFLSILLVLLALVVVAEARAVPLDPNSGGINQMGVAKPYTGGSVPAPQQSINPSSAVTDKPLMYGTVESVGGDYEKSLPTVRPEGVPIAPLLGVKEGVVDPGYLPLFGEPKPNLIRAGQPVAPLQGGEAGELGVSFSENEKLLKLKAEGVTSVKDNSLYLEGEKVEVLPYMALERAKLETKGEISDVTLVKKELAEGQKPVYEVNASRPARFLGIFQVAVPEKVEVSATDGQVVKAARPWWSWLAF